MTEHAGVEPPRSFAADDTPTTAALLAGPWRTADGARFGAPLRLSHDKAAEGAQALGLERIGDLLEHLPRDRREARTVSALGPGEQATVVVDIRSISSRPVRKRGMRPIVEAVVADETGSMKVAFFNQPWLVGKYPAGTRLVLHGTFDARNRFRVTSHAPTSDGVGSAGEVAHYPATEGLSSTQILALVREHLPVARCSPEPLPGRMRARHRLPDRAAALIAAHSADLEGGRRRLAFEELLLVQLDLLRRRLHRRDAVGAVALDGQGDGLVRRWLGEILPFEPRGIAERHVRGRDGDDG